MKTREYIISLYEIYKSLLTLKQQQYFEYYYYEDLSLSEIKENTNVSRTIISKTINVVEDKLKYYEDNLNIYKKNNKLREVIKTIKEEDIKEQLNSIL